MVPMEHGILLALAIAALMVGSAQAGDRHKHKPKAGPPWDKPVTVEPNGSGGYTVYEGAHSKGRLEPNGVGGYRYEKRTVPAPLRDKHR